MVFFLMFLEMVFKFFDCFDFIDLFGVLGFLGGDFVIGFLIWVLGLFFGEGIVFLGVYLLVELSCLFFFLFLDCGFWIGNLEFCFVMIFLMGFIEFDVVVGIFMRLFSFRILFKEWLFFLNVVK